MAVGMGAPGAALGATRDELLANVKVATEGWLDALEEDTDKMDKGRACTAAAEAAIAGGVDASTEVKLVARLPKGLKDEDVPGRRVDSEWNSWYPLSSVGDWLCKKAMVIIATNRAATGAGKGAVWIGEFAVKSPKIVDLHLMTYAAEEAKSCSARVAEALAAGAAADAPIEFYHYDAKIEGAARDGASSTLPLGDVDAKVCKPALALADGAVKSILAAAAAALAPYLKALSGDKLKIFKARGLLGYVVRGPGGRVLTTPEDFRDATAWYTCGLDSTGAWPTWSVDGWRFKGMKLDGKYSKSGVGTDYPRGVFP
jgi:hypothetical protein